MPVTDAKNVWLMMNTGFVGPYRDYLLGFMSIQQDPKKRKTIEELFPHVNDFMKLKDHLDQSDRELAISAAAALLSMPGNSGAPEWLKKAASGG